MRQVITNKAKWQSDSEGSWICFRVPAESAARMVEDLSDGREHQLTLKQYRHKRSKDANAYFWTLCGELAARLRISPMDVYRNYIPDVGDNFYVVPVKTNLVTRISDEWCRGHDGRMVVNMGPSKLEGYTNLRMFIGSSDYDTVQMSKLIDMVVEDCKAQGIDTLTPQDKQLLLQEWEYGQKRI